ncbi:putative UDP-glucuronosyltransferase ugt-58 [Trichoplusia ni]|uniref:UDP-glucuronosyltransferase n=1 Tax=Trichoplusia ni TaxID=7111 RepID=A0A7E5W2N1_TRINI|nr:putative UDP-glucuronosyltransferase ugt-58 [Trichoplusia ni]XP_026734531.1 putative UDP-glucuronosyltransferase ugt-58 [Trichoplusia ni]
MGLMKFCAVLVLAYLSQAVEGASILALFSSLSYTDHLVFRGYVSLLAQKGHSVVVMTAYPGHFRYPEAENIIEIDVGEDSSLYWEEYRKLMTNTDDLYQRLKAINEFSVKLAIVQLKSKQMTALFINPNVIFDLVITEADVPLLYAVAEKYKAPHIAITTSSGKIHQHESKGNPIHPLLYPDVNSLSYRNSSIWDKVVEFYRNIQTRAEYYNNYLPLCELAANKILGLKRSLQQVENDIDLLFIASNPVLSGSRPSVPAVIYVDRMHIKPGLGMPQDLRNLLDSSTKGVVYFSLGAMQEAEQLSPAILQTLAECFRELPFTVLWKIGNTTMFDKPENVIARSWFPQQQVLAHPNVKAFITHGGSRSLEEAVFYGVPIIGFPTVKSRKVFIQEITMHGAGEIIDPYKLDKDTLKATITAVSTNENYEKAMAILRTTVVDPIISGPENAVWWTEYVLRHGEARHLHSPAVGLSFFKYYMLDTLTYFILMILIVLILTYLAIRTIVRRLRQRFSGNRTVDEAGKFKAL